MNTTHSPLKVFFMTSEFLIIRILFLSAALYPSYELIMWSYRMGREYLHSTLYLTDAFWMFGGIVLSYAIFKWPYKLLLHIISFAHVASVILHVQGVTHRRTLKSFVMVIKRIGATMMMLIVDHYIRKSSKEVSTWLVGKTENFPKFIKQGFLSRLLKKSIETIVFSSTECVMGYLFVYPEVNVWQGSISGVGTYFKSWKSVIKSALVTTVKVKLAGIVLRIGLVVAVMYILKGNITDMLIFYVCVKVFSVLVDKCIVQPYVMISILIRVDYSQEIEESLIEKIESISSTFSGLLTRSSSSRNTSATFEERIRSLFDSSNDTSAN